MLISLVAAMDENGVIGVGNRLPWRLPGDLRRFREITWGKPVVMGRSTHASIRRPLPGRLNIVMTRDCGYRAPGCRVVHGVAEALDAASGASEVMIIGGASIYEQLLSRAGRMYLTLIHHAFEGDTFFPAFDPSEWREIEREQRSPQSEDSYAHTFLVLDRK